MKFKSIILLAVLAIMPLSSHAAFLTGDAITIDQAQGENLYIAGKDVRIDQPVDGDVFVAAQSVVISAPVSGDVFVAAQDVMISAQIAGDLRGAAQDVVIDASVGGEVLSAGRNITFTQNATVARDVYVGGEVITISAPLAGSLTSSADRITFGEAASVAGSVDLYEMSKSQVQYLSSSDIEQSVRYHGGVGRQVDEVRDHMTVIGIVAIVIALAIALSIAVLYPILLTYCGGRHVQAMHTNDIKTFLVRGAIGFASMWVLPITVLLLLITGVGAPLGIFLILLAFVIILLAIPLASIMLGKYVISLIRHMRSIPASAPTMSRYRSAAIGGVTMFFVSMVPILGGLVSFILLCAAIGSIYTFLYATLQSSRK